MRITFILICCLSISGCGFTNLKNHEYAWQAMHLIDAAQTVQIAKNPECHAEGNPLTKSFIGMHPSEEEVYYWWAGSAIVHFFLFDWLDKNFKKGDFNLFFRLTDNADKLRTIAQNHSRGLRVDGLSNSEEIRCDEEKQRRSSLNFTIMEF